MKGKDISSKNFKVNGNQAISDQKIGDILGLVIGEPYNPVESNENLYLLENEYFDLGKTIFTVDIKDIVEDSVSVIIDIEENKNVHIKNTFF